MAFEARSVALCKEAPANPSRGSYRVSPISRLADLAAASTEREEADRASAHTPCCHHRAARNATACLTNAGNNASAGCRRAMNCALDRMGCSCGWQRKTGDEKCHKD